MLESSARRASQPVLTAIVTALVTLLVLTGCTSGTKSSPPPAAPTPMSGLNTASMHLPRIRFCSLVPGSAVKDALGAKPDGHASYGNGDRQDLPGVGRQVLQELGCAWTTDAGAAARAWVFAQPVDAAGARTVVLDSKRQVGCTPEQGPQFGDPALFQVCRAPGGAQRVRHAGLFGQTWLTCEVTGTGSDVRQRAEQWCVQVVNALDTAR